ncbi:MAG: mandelate racemase/muconate lactonizing enzyme family protein [Pseudomonadota bacterium]
MRATKLKTTLVDLPLAKPITTAIHDMRSVGCVLVELETDEGITGESYVFTLNAIRLKALHEMVLGFAHQVEGKDPHDVANINSAMWQEMNPIGHAGFAIAALSAIDVACWDVIGKAANKSLGEIFGLCRNRVRAYASGGLWLSQSIDECVREAGEFIDAGFRSMKLRLGSEKIADDVERVRAVRETIGEDKELLVDANQCFSVAHAIELGRALEPFDLGWYEEPVDYQNLTGHAEVRASVSIPIASGETEYTHVGMQRYLDAGAVDILMPDLQRIGGYSEFCHSADIASKRDIPLSTHIFTEHSLCLAASIEQCISVEHMPWFSPLFNEEMKVVDGCVSVPEAPGTGFTFNHSCIEKYKIGCT